MKISNYIKKVTLSVLFLGMSLMGYGQQYPTFSEYGFNPYSIIPAYSGLLQSAEVSLCYGGTDFQSVRSPRTLSLSAIVPFLRKNFVLGASYVSDRVGVTSVNTAKVSYAYRLLIGEPSREERKLTKLDDNILSLSIDTGFRSINDELLRLRMVSDPRLNENVKAVILNLGISLMYNHRDFYVGLAAYNLLGEALSQNENELFVEQPYYVNLGYRFYLSDERNIILTPNIFVRHNFVTPMILDYNVKLNFRNSFEAGFGYRDVGAFSFSAGVCVLDRFRLLYTFNQYTKVNFFTNSHGVMINYRF